MILQADVTFRRGREAGHFRELRFCELLVPVRGTDFVFAILHAVEPVLALVVIDLEFEKVPLADGFGAVFFGGVELVKPACFLRILAFHIILDLRFRAGDIRRAVRLLHAEHDAAVAAFADLPFHGEFKVLIHVLGNDVAAAMPDERAVFRLPALG